MAKARVLVFSGYGLNCERETLEAFNIAGIDGNIHHVNYLMENPSIIENYQIIAIPGGFSFGDDTGSGNALSIKIASKLIDYINKFRESGGLMIGICNGCQVISRMFPEFELALVNNIDEGQYVCDWVEVEIEKNTKSVWLKGLDKINLPKKLPLAHAEGRFYMSEQRLKELNQNGQVALRYMEGNNFNGSVDSIAAVCDESGRVLCIMPHPERAVFINQLDDWHLIKEKKRRGLIPEDSLYCDNRGLGYHIFKNVSNYFN